MTHSPHQRPNPQDSQSPLESGDNLIVQRWRRLRALRRKLNKEKSGKTRTAALSIFMGVAIGADLILFTGGLSSFLVIAVHAATGGLSFTAYRGYEKNRKELEESYIRKNKILRELVTNRRQARRRAKAASATPPVLPALLKLAGQPAQDFTAKAMPVDKTPTPGNNGAPENKLKPPTQNP
jgi:hypothetical protein